MTLIETHALKKEYLMGKVIVNALRGVDVKIGKGEFVALVGPSGSGKSTLMHLIGGLDYPTEGTVSVEGEDLYKMTEGELAHFRGMKVGFVFQSFNLFNLLSARENVYFPMQFSDIPFNQWGVRADELLELVKLGDWKHHKPTEMSGGQQQRVAIARALANHPDILLADEPTGELDTTTSLEIMALFDRIRKEQGTTVIIVTHDTEMAALADRQIKLIDGHVVSDIRNHKPEVKAKGKQSKKIPKKKKKKTAPKKKVTGKKGTGKKKTKKPA